MEGFTSTLITFLTEHTILLYFVAFATGLVESVPVIGNVSPSTFLLLALGVVAGVDGLGVALLVVVVLAGAIMSDWIAYYLGKNSQRFFTPDSKYLRQAHVEKGKVFFDQYGTWSVFLGRFVSPIRPVIAFTAGLCSMNMKKFWVFNVSGAIIWALAYTLPGYLMGFGLQDIARIDRFLMWAGIGGVLFYVLSYGIYEITRKIISKNEKSLS